MKNYEKYIRNGERINVFIGYNPFDKLSPIFVKGPKGHDRIEGSVNSLFDIHSLNLTNQRFILAYINKLNERIDELEQKVEELKNE